MAEKESIVSGIISGKMKAREVAHALYYFADTIHEKNIDIQTRELWIHGEWTNAHDSGEYGEPGVEHNMATKVIKNLHILKNASRTEPITIHLHTCGGFVEEGLAIYDAIKAMPYKVKMISYTHARSMSSIILQAADERVMLPSSIFMYHEGTFGIWDTQKGVYSAVDFNRHHYDKVMMAVYVNAIKKYGPKDYRKWTDKKIANMLQDNMNKKQEVFLTAEEAIEWGFADKILTKF